MAEIHTQKGQKTTKWTVVSDGDTVYQYGILEVGQEISTIFTLDVYDTEEEMAARYKEITGHNPPPQIV